MIDIATADEHGHWNVADIKLLCQYRDELVVALNWYKKQDAQNWKIIGELQTQLARYEGQPVVPYTEPVQPQQTIGGLGQHQPLNPTMGKVDSPGLVVHPAIAKQG
jgi:hypothetical protein